MVTSPRDSINTHSLFHVYISFLPAQKSRWKIFRLIGLQTHSTKWNWSLNTEIQMSGTEIEYGVWENERDGSAYVLLHKSISEDKKPAKSNVFFVFHFAQPISHCSLFHWPGTFFPSATLNFDIAMLIVAAYVSHRCVRALHQHTCVNGRNRFSADLINFLFLFCDSIDFDASLTITQN